MAPSPHRGNVAHIKAFTGLDPSPPLATFIKSDTAEAATLSEIQHKKSVNINDLKKSVADVHPVVQKSLEDNR